MNKVWGCLTTQWRCFHDNKVHLQIYTKHYTILIVIFKLLRCIMQVIIVFLIIR